MRRGGRPRGAEKETQGKEHHMALTEEGLIAIPGIRSEWVKLPSGAMAHYSAAGDTGPAIILIHGGIQGSSGQAGWRYMMPFLAEQGFRVYAPDRPGFGLADTREDYLPHRGFMSWVEYIEDFARALNLKQFHIAGNSQGAQTASYYAVYHPERVISMALIATGGFNSSMGVDPSLVKPGLGMPKFEGTQQSMKEAMTSIIYRQEAISDDLLTMRTNAANAQARAFDVAAAWNREAQKDPNRAHLLDLRGKLDKSTIPTIYLYGMQDVLGPVENAYLQEEKLPNIQFFYPDECGHQGQTDQPDMHNQAFLEFFRDGKVSRKTADWAGVSKRRPELANLVEQA
jgi:pimeloyl-ACP methyl ester carboxylesterase